MNKAAQVLEHRHVTLILTGETPDTADHDRDLAADAAPRFYTALTERPPDFHDIFVPARRQCTETAPTYKALTERPAGSRHADFFAPPRRQMAEQAIPTYIALTSPIRD